MFQIQRVPRKESTVEDWFIFLATKIFEVLEKTEETNALLRKGKMDKQIKKIEKGVKKSEKQLKSLEKMDKKRDKVCDMGKKMMKKKK